MTRGERIRSAALEAKAFAKDAEWDAKMSIYNKDPDKAYERAWNSAAFLEAGDIVRDFGGTVSKVFEEIASCQV